MKLIQLKQETYECWQRLSIFNSAVVQPENFRAEVRTFGDLRRKNTWKRAYCSFMARNIDDSCLDACNLILIQFNYQPSDWDYELRHKIFSEFLALSRGPELLKTALEQLFSTELTKEERKEADGFFKLAGEQSTRGSNNRETTQLMGRVAVLSSAL
ncbi:MAG: hypothetical protein WA865_09440 [Spirulinaceae cyanobacterium]